MTLTLLEVTNLRTSDNHIIAKYLCSCGEVTTKAQSRVKNGYVSTCTNTKLHYPPAIKHGMRKSVEYKVWTGIKNRVFNKNSKDYGRYGAGVGMSDALATDFMAFYRELGARPSDDHQVDRIDNRKGYIEGNLRWATRIVNASNRKDSYFVWIDGVKYQSMADASRRLKVSETTIRRWCEGYADKRRNIQTQPRKGCRRERKY